MIRTPLFRPGLECGMASTEDRNRSAPATSATDAAFEFHSFEWEGPDRLEVSGRFVGLDEEPAGAPELVVHGADEIHRLTLVPGSDTGPLGDGRRWSAVFAWEAAPVPCDAVELVFENLSVELPAPGTRRSRLRPLKLEARRRGGSPAQASDPAGTQSMPAPVDEGSSGGAAERLRLQTELMAAREEARDLGAAVRRAERDLPRVRADLEAEQERRAADAKRFRLGLESLRESAEAALHAEQATAQRLGSELREAHAALDARNAALEDLTAQLRAVTGAREEAEAAAREENDALRHRVAALEAVGEGVEQLQQELQRTRERADAMEVALHEARAAAEAAGAEARRLQARIEAIRDALGEETPRP
jgi:hypothetical protein